MPPLPRAPLPPHFLKVSIFHQVCSLSRPVVLVLRPNGSGFSCPLTGGKKLRRRTQDCSNSSVFSFSLFLHLHVGVTTSPLPQEQEDLKVVH